MSKQLTFDKPVTVTLESKSGDVISKNRIKYGYFESILIVKENGLDVNRTKTLNIPDTPVTNVECVNGDKLHFDEPPYFI